MISSMLSAMVFLAFGSIFLGIHSMSIFLGMGVFVTSLGLIWGVRAAIEKALDKP